MAHAKLREREERTARLRQGRERDSREKRARALRACADLVTAGIPVTHTRVARVANVSPWLTYNAQEIRAAIDLASAGQIRDGLADPNISRKAGPRATVASLRTDLDMARDEVKDLRAERKRLRARLEQRLGAEVESASATELFERLREVEDANRQLRQSLTERDKQAMTLAERVAELEQEVEAKEQALRAMMFAKNTQS
jgi:hypothetical protein